MGDLWQKFEQTAKRRGQCVAIVQGDRSVSFEWWHRRALAYAARLTEEGLQRHDRVLLRIENSAEMAAAMLGVWAAGGIVVIQDVAAPEVHYQHALELTEPAIVLCDSHDATHGGNWPARSVAAEDIPATTRSVDLPHPALATDPASIVFTSGSTGRPKGVTQSHGNLMRACSTVGAYLGLTKNDRILCPVPWSFDYGYGQLLSTALLGAVQVLPAKIDPFAICEAIEQHQPTVLAGTPNLFAYFLRGVSPFRRIDLSSLRIVTSTGGTIPEAVFDEMLTAFEHSSIFLNYGLTESYRTTCLRPDVLRDYPQSIGKAIPGVDVVIVGDDGSVLGPDEEGEIVHRGDFLFLGYWNNPTATQAALRTDPLTTAGCPPIPPALFTGDYGHKDRDGRLYFHGRRDHMLKSMGARVSAGEVEELLLESGLVREVAVFGMKHDFIGDEIWAAVVPDTETVDYERLLKEYARSVMSPSMQPRRYLSQEMLPRTHTGKTDYYALQQETQRSHSALAFRH